MTSLPSLLQLIGAFGLGGALVIGLGLYLINHPSVLFAAWSTAARATHRVFGWRKRAAVGSKIERHVNDAIHQLAREAPAAFDKGFRLKWLTTGEELSSLEDGTVVIRVRDDPDPAKPLVAATLLYLKDGVVPHSRPFLDNRLTKAIDLVLAHRLLETSPYRGAVTFLTTSHIDPALADDITASYYEEADTIDRAGLLTRVVLREFSALPAKLVGRRPTRAMRAESVNFFRFVGRLVGRTSEVPLRFFGAFLRCTLALVAKTSVYERVGLELYQINFKRDIELGVQVIYVLARGPRNIHIARHLAKWATDQGLISGALADRFIQPDETGEPVAAESIACLSSRSRLAIELSPSEEAQIAVSRYIPETLTGEVDVLSVAREPGKVTKVLVHSDLQVDPIQLCAGPRRERLPLISHDLSPDETIDFVPWNPDPHLNVVSALTPLHADDVVSVRLAPNGLSATVVVRSSAAARRAVGTEGVNLRVAERLLGIHIDLETREAPIPPQEEVAAVLAYRIPEIERNEISVVGIARRVGRACKIAVTSPTGASLHRACIGPGGATVSAISKDLGNEQVSFVFWDPSRMERCIVDALFPLRRQEVTSTHYDSVARHAIVTVRGSSSSRKAIGRDGDNVRLAEEICGVRIEIRRA